MRDFIIRLALGLALVLAVAACDEGLAPPVGEPGVDTIRIMVGKLVCLAKEKRGPNEAYRREVEFQSSGGTAWMYWDPSGTDPIKVGRWTKPSDLEVVVYDLGPFWVEGRIYVAGEEDHVVRWRQEVAPPFERGGYKLDPEPGKNCDNSDNSR